MSVGLDRYIRVRRVACLDECRDIVLRDALLRLSAERRVLYRCSHDFPLLHVLTELNDETILRVRGETKEV